MVGVWIAYSDSSSLNMKKWHLYWLLCVITYKSQHTLTMILQKNNSPSKEKVKCIYVLSCHSQSFLHLVLLGDSYSFWHDTQFRSASAIHHTFVSFAHNVHIGCLNNNVSEPMIFMPQTLTVLFFALNLIL